MGNTNYFKGGKKETININREIFCKQSQWAQSVTYVGLGRY